MTIGQKRKVQDARLFLVPDVDLGLLFRSNKRQRVDTALDTDDLIGLRFISESNKGGKDFTYSDDDSDMDDEDCMYSDDKDQEDESIGSRFVSGGNADNEDFTYSDDEDQEDELIGLRFISDGNADDEDFMYSDDEDQEDELIGLRFISDGNADDEDFMYSDDEDQEDDSIGLGFISDSDIYSDDDEDGDKNSNENDDDEEDAENGETLVDDVKEEEKPIPLRRSERLARVPRINYCETKKVIRRQRTFLARAAKKGPKRYT
jgi:hypothetical protein